MLRELNVVFGNAFDDAGAYQGAVPSDKYLESMIAGDDFIPLVAVADGR